MDSKIKTLEYSDITINKINYLKAFKTNLLARAYIHTLIGGLYIKLADYHSGYANEVVKDELLSAYPYEATASMIPFFKENDCLIRGALVDDSGSYYQHSWISFSLNNRTYIFDPAQNIAVPKEIYESIFLPEIFGSVTAHQVKTDLLDTLAEGEETTDGFRIINKSNDINSSFYKSDMQIKGETINRKILTLTARFKNS